MAQTGIPQLIDLLRTTLEEIQKSDHADTPALEELKRSILRTMNELQQERSQTSAT